MLALDIKNTFSAVSLLFDGVLMGKPDFGRIPFTPGKTVLTERERAPFFPTSSVHRAHCNGEALLSFLRTVSESPESGVHSVVVLSHGKCVFEASSAGYDTCQPHATFSLCKTVTGLAIGMLVDDGKLSLDDKAIALFPKYKSLFTSPKMRSLTVRHLLSMSTGVVFNEIGAATEEDFLRSYFSSRIRFAPGTEFSYNSMNSYLLAAIVCRVSGTSLSDFLRERLFEPLGIPDFFWEKSATGIEKGGWGLYLSPRSMARLGQFFLSGGTANGKRLISERFIREMTSVQMHVPEKIGPFDYGYQMWVHRENSSLLLNGMLGQNVWVYPKEELVVAITAGDNCIFQDAHTLVSAMSAFTASQSVPTRGRFALQRELRRLRTHFGEGASYTPPIADSEALSAERLMPRESLYGKYAVSRNNTALLPLVVRTTQNSPSRGIRLIKLAPGGSVHRMTLTFSEGTSHYTIPVGRYHFVSSVLSVEGEIYRVAAAYSYGRDEERRPYFKIELRFPELPSSRRLLFREGKEGLTLLLGESPGAEFVQKLLTVTPAIVGENVFLDLLGKRTPAFLTAKLSQTFSPLLTLTRRRGD